MKSTQSTTYRSLNAELGSISNRLETLRNQAATGKKLIRPSDEPAAIRPVLSARTQIRATDRFISSLETAGDRLAHQDSNLDQVENLLVGAKETAINAINSAMSPADLNTLADQIGYMKTEMISVANSQVGGQYLFAGFLDDKPPFVVDGDTVSYQGDSNIKRLETAPGEYVNTNLDGAQLFMGMSDTDGDGTLEQTGQNVFEVLTNLERAIRGEAGQVYIGSSALPSSDIGYLDAPDDYTPVALDGAGEQLLDVNGDAIPLTFAGEPIDLQPIDLQPVVGVDGQQLSIADYNTQFFPAVTSDYNGIPLDPAVLDKPMYLYNDGSTPVAFDANGDPVLAYSETGASGLTHDTYVASGTPLAATATGTPMTGSTADGDVTIGGVDVVASDNAVALAANIVTASGNTVAATAADSSTGTDLNTFVEVGASAPTALLQTSGITGDALDAGDLFVNGVDVGAVPSAGNMAGDLKIAIETAALSANATSDIVVTVGEASSGELGAFTALADSVNTDDLGTYDLSVETGGTSVNILSVTGLAANSVADTDVDALLNGGTLDANSDGILDGNTNIRYEGTAVAGTLEFFSVDGSDIKITESLTSGAGTPDGILTGGFAALNADSSVDTPVEQTTYGTLAINSVSGETIDFTGSVAAAKAGFQNTDNISSTDNSFSLSVEGVSLLSNDTDGVIAADIDAALQGLTPADNGDGSFTYDDGFGTVFTFSGSAVAGDLEITKADGDNIDIIQTLGGAANSSGFTSLSGDVAGDIYYGSVTISSSADFTVGGTAVVTPISLLSAGTPLHMTEVPTLDDMLATLETTADQSRSARGLMGNNAQRIDASRQHLEGVRVDLEQILSRYEDVDIIDVITEITQTETAFEAALNVTGKVGRLSILDYI